MKRLLAKFTIKALAMALIVGNLTFPQLAYANSSFKDTKGHWAENTIKWGQEKGIASGYPDGTFKPNQTVTEAEFLAILLRNWETIPKVDNEEHWADGIYLVAAVQKTYPVWGYSDRSLRNTPIKRVQVAELISSTQGVNYSGNDAIQYVLGKRLASGTDANNVTIASFQGDRTLTRAEALQFIKNLVDGGITKLDARPSKPSDRSLLPALPGQSKNSDVEKVQKAVGNNYVVTEGINSFTIKTQGGDNVGAYGKDKSEVINYWSAHTKEGREAVSKMLDSLGVSYPSNFNEVIAKAADGPTDTTIKHGGKTFHVTTFNLKGRITVVVE